MPLTPGARKRKNNPHFFSDSRGKQWDKTVSHGSLSSLDFLLLFGDFCQYILYDNITIFLDVYISFIYNYDINGHNVSIEENRRTR